MKVVAMIPARLGSKRIEKKNIRLLNGTPLLSYIIKAAQHADCFDEIYVNSESDLIGEIALKEGVCFYKRPPALSSDSSTNDDFALDFIEKVDCDVLVQVLSTSPFISPNEINSFVREFVDKGHSTLISTKPQKIECVYQNEAINFHQKEQTPPSQLLTPIHAYACGLMAWDIENFKVNMKKYGSAYHGGDGNIGFYPLKGYSTLDIDEEEDFQLAEVVARFLNTEKLFKKEYYNSKLRTEIDVSSILKKDGVLVNDLGSANSEIPVNIKTIIDKFDKNRSWSKRVVNTENNSATIICQKPGDGNRIHHHPDWNEWWYIIDGAWEWNIEEEKVIVGPGDFVFIPKGKKHKITAVGNKPAIRLAISREDVAHVYDLGDDEV